MPLALRPLKDEGLKFQARGCFHASEQFHERTQTPQNHAVGVLVGRLTCTLPLLRQSGRLSDLKKSGHDLAEYAIRQLVTIYPYCRREAPEVLPCAGFAGEQLLSDES